MIDMKMHFKPQMIHHLIQIGTYLLPNLRIQSCNISNHPCMEAHLLVIVLCHIEEAIRDSMVRIAITITKSTSYKETKQLVSENNKTDSFKHTPNLIMILNKNSKLNIISFYSNKEHLMTLIWESDQTEKNSLLIHI